MTTSTTSSPTATAGIWTSYGDERIYGDHPETGAGLAGWNTDGIPTWSPQGRLPVRPLGGSAGATEEAVAWLARYSHEGAFVSRVDPATGDISSYRNPLKDTDDAWVISAQEKLRLPGPGRHVLRPRPRRHPLGRPSVGIVTARRPTRHDPTRYVQFMLFRLKPSRDGQSHRSTVASGLARHRRRAEECP
ncbi:hypothetical protein [Streptomyces sp. NPDC054958]